VESERSLERGMPKGCRVSGERKGGWQRPPRRGPVTTGKKLKAKGTKGKKSGKTQ